MAAETGDMQRLSRALRSKKHFDLVSEADVRSVRDHLAAEIAPQLKELIVRAEEALQRDERRAKTLKAKVRSVVIGCTLPACPLILSSPQATQQNGRLEQLAQQHQVTVDDLRRLDDADGNETRADEGGNEPVPSREVEGLTTRLKALQAKRVALQDRLNELEKGSL